MRESAEDWVSVLERLRRGDRVALVRLSSLVTGYLARFGAYDYRDSWEDVCQEVLLKLVSLDAVRLRSRTAFVGFVGTVTRNAMIDWIRKERSRAHRAGPGNPGLAVEALGRLEARLAAHERPDLRVDLERALSELPDPQRRAIGAIYLEGYSYREAAERLGIPLGTLKRRQTEGLRRLRDRMIGPQTAADPTAAALASSEEG